jgi:CheY-like chemotaxis protein
MVLDVILADDEDALRDLTKDFLERILPGVVVREAKDGKEALALLHARLPDLLVTDYNMPEHNGAEVSQKARHELQYAGGIIVASGQVADATAAIQAMLGDDQKITILAKPYPLPEMKEAVLRYVTQ